MTNKILEVAFLMSLLFQSSSVESNYSGKSGLSQVGMVTRDFYDDSRSNWLGNGPRPLRVDVWYPSIINSGKEELIKDQNQFTGPVIIRKDGKLSSLKQKYPLIVISHGSYGNSSQMQWLGYYLAEHGYISVAINHNGNSAEEKQLEQLTLSELCMWERPRDVSVVLDKILQDPVFGLRIDKNRIGVAGFSLGGATAIWTGGAILNMDSLRVNAPELTLEMRQLIQRQIDMTKNDTLVQQSVLRAQNSYRDERIRAIFALAPAIGFGFTAEGLKGINVPVLIVVGDGDVVAPMSGNAQRYYKYIRNAKLIILPGERGHYTQKAQGNEHAVELGEVSSIALKFFQEMLR